jgi:hypothetical protein
MSLQSNINVNPAEIVDQIDLHGYTKSLGIYALTFFLDQTIKKHKGRAGHLPVWVLVITGSGAHSHDGPVLRYIVQALLEKRCMAYTLNHGKGSFTVNANSGHVLYSPDLPTDTKVLVIDAPERVPRLPGRSSRINPSAINPTLQEAAMSDAYVQESRSEQHKANMEERAFERAVSLSSTMDGEEKRKDDNRLLELLERALSMSVTEKERVDEDEKHASDLSERELQGVLELSQTDFAPEDDHLKRALEISQKESARDVSENDGFQRAMKLSEQNSRREEEKKQNDENRLLESMERALRMSATEKQRADEDEKQASDLSERELQGVLELSETDFAGVDDHLKRALELSQKEFARDGGDNDGFQRAMKLSEQTNRREEEEWRRVLEASKQEHENEINRYNHNIY